MCEDQYHRPKFIRICEKFPRNRKVSLTLSLSLSLFHSHSSLFSLASSCVCFPVSSPPSVSSFYVLALSLSLSLSLCLPLCLPLSCSLSRLFFFFCALTH